MNLQLALNLVEQIEWILARTIHLVYKDHHRCVTHTADIHQSASLCLDTLCTVDNDDYRIDRSEGTVCVLGEDVGGNCRFQSLGEIRYCVESINIFAPFIRKIFIVTDGQDP